MVPQLSNRWWSGWPLGADSSYKAIKSCTVWPIYTRDEYSGLTRGGGRRIRPGARACMDTICCSSMIGYWWKIQYNLYFHLGLIDSEVGNWVTEGKLNGKCNVIVWSLSNSKLRALNFPFPLLHSRNWIFSHSKLKLHLWIFFFINSMSKMVSSSGRDVGDDRGFVCH